MEYSYHLSKNCENCEFRVEQMDIKGDAVNMCILTDKHVGLIWTCNRYKEKKGEHYSR